MRAVSAETASALTPRRVSALRTLRPSEEGGFVHTGVGVGRCPVVWHGVAWP